MTKRTRLRWGETPWDDLSREELLREVQRMYAAVNAMYSALAIVSHGDVSGYWGPDGSGGRALEMGRQIEEPLRDRYGDTMFRAFFRYAIDLLFECRPGFRIGYGWVVCPVCGQLSGDYEGGSHIGKRCADLLPRPGPTGGLCIGVLRPLEWSDLAQKH